MLDMLSTHDIWKGLTSSLLLTPVWNMTVFSDLGQVPKNVSALFKLYADSHLKHSFIVLNIYPRS